MSILIKGMKMPENCDACPMFFEYRLCSLTDDHASSIEWKTEEKRMPNCPLIELPDHGDEEVPRADVPARKVGEWDMFELITSAYFGKQYYFVEDNGIVYSRETHKYMTKEDAISEFLGIIGE